MQKAKLVRCLTILCPGCRSVDYLTYRRSPAGIPGHVTNRCSCRRCGKHFEYEEDRVGNPCEE